MRLANDNILVIGDRDRRMQSAVAGAMPAASITSVQSIFDAIAELNAGMFNGVLLAIEPLEARPEAAIRTLREAAGDGRVVLYSSPAHEPLSRRLIDLGADDYVIAPAEPKELQQALAGAPLVQDLPPAPAGSESPATPEIAPSPLQALLDLPMADIVLGAMLEHPQRALQHAIDAINQRLGATMSVTFQHAEDEPLPMAGDGRVVLSHSLRDEDSSVVGRLVLEIRSPAGEQPTDELKAQHALVQIGSILAKAQQIDDRQARLQKLAITDDLTGIHNARYFRHFLSRIIEKAKQHRFPVTLLLFDLDNFKKYNDTYGHGVGDEILKQTASLMKRCSRDHDLVARISGDEFAVVFWEKEGPRKPFDAAIPPARLPQTPLQIADRFRKMLGNKDFTEFSLLGPSGKGVLSISGGMSVYPYDARTPEELIEAADKALMFGAKKGGKNSIYLVGGEEDAMAGQPE